jgi:hypothetical protein
VRVVVQNTGETWRTALVPVGHRVYLSWAEGATLVLHEGGGAALETGEEDEPMGGRGA